MATNTVGIDKEVEVNRKENLRDHRLYWIGRRTQDIILSSVALVVLSPVMLATAIAIVVDDPSAGPVFSQERIGRNGKPFKFYKFRSMCPNAEAKLDDLLDQNEMEGVFGAEEGQGVFNGDIGFIVSIDPQEHVMSVQFDDERVAEYEGADVDDLELAYCISVHKSQGSEFPVVVMPAVGGPPMLLTRNQIGRAHV